MLAMSFGFTVALVALGFVVLMYGVAVYNGLVALKNQCHRAFANVEVILKQRYDEIPQLLQVIEQFARYERGTIDRLVNARQNYGRAQDIPQKIQASQEISFALRGVLAVGEGYPELKSNAQFVQLQSRVSELEGALADRRESYNEAVTNYNTRCQMIPDVWVATFLGYTALELYRVAPEEMERPKLKMDLPA